MDKIRIKTGGNWRSWWGNMPLPKGAEAVGTVQTENGQGALIRLESGQYVQGNAGAISNLPQNEIIKKI